MPRRAAIGALLLIGVGVILGATVFRADIAQATGLVPSKDLRVINTAADSSKDVKIINTAAEPVPVREQNLDAGGNIKVHEQGRISVSPLVPANPWHRVRIVNVGSSPFLSEEPSSSPINITSLTVAETIGGSPGGATAVLSSFIVPNTATDCSGSGAGDTLWFSTMVTSPLAVAFPTPLVASAPTGSKVCLRASAQGESGDSVWFSLSGFFGDE